jgi:hypothetical protein
MINGSQRFVHLENIAHYKRLIVEQKRLRCARSDASRSWYT